MANTRNAATIEERRLRRLEERFARSKKLSAYAPEFEAVNLGFYHCPCMICDMNFIAFCLKARRAAPQAQRSLREVFFLRARFNF